MKTSIKNLFTCPGGAWRPAWVLPALIAGLGLILAGQVAAQSFTTLYNFTNGSDGAHPYAALILSGNTLYGTASEGGSSGAGTVFAANTDGSGFTILHSFTNGSDGAYPRGGLILSGNTLYGTAQQGGNAGSGTVFAVNTDGSGFTTLHSFTNGSDGAYPYAGLILSGNTLYGTANGGDSPGPGTVFAVNTDGAGFTTLHSFTNRGDGAYPRGGLVLSGNTLYGTAAGGGGLGWGTVFAVITNGTGFTTLHGFTNGSDGAYPYAGLILSGNTLYGTANGGGSSAAGTVFAVNTDGSGFTTLHSFTNGSDGAYPYAGLILSGNTLYGTAIGGGSSADYGTVFGVNTNGTGFTTLHSFTYGSDGEGPMAGLILSGNILYGTAWGGGSSGYGTVFAVNTNSPGFTTLHSFTATSGSYPGPYINNDGNGPRAGLILSGKTLYGTAAGGGSSGDGTVFAFNTSGTDFRTLHSFTITDGNGKNSDGADPYGGLILSGNTLYGTAAGGGSSGAGTVFAVNIDGSAFTTLHSFTYGSSGAFAPHAGLILSGNTLYGTAADGGNSGNGAVFAVNTDGAGFTTLHSFTFGSDGDGPAAGLILSGNTLYGTVAYGGSSGNGTVFAVNTDGSGFTTLHSFTELSRSSTYPYPLTNSDGAVPTASLILSGNTLYGTAGEGGSGGNGTVFAVSTDGTSFTNLHSFTETYYTDETGTYINSDGGGPAAGLILSGNALYGTATGGGGSGWGTVFGVKTNGTGFTTLYSFTRRNDGSGPLAGLISSGGTLYGTTTVGGSTDNGTVFALTLTFPTPLNIQLNGAGVVVSWNDPATAFSLQSAPTVTGLFTNIPGATSPYTNMITGKQQFFRLMAN